MAELDPQIIKKTQDTLGKYVKKPALTEKLLKKPPFRFLHDIITSVIQSSGYLEGLFEPDEMVSANIKDKDAKIIFLQKIIDVVKVSTKENVKAKPSKIVAGHEPERTNELLQLIGLALDKKVDSTEAVKLVKSNKVSEAVNKSNKNVSTKPNKVVTQSSVESVKTKSKSSEEVKTKIPKGNSKTIPKTKESKDKINEGPSRDLKVKESKNTKEKESKNAKEKESKDTKEKESKNTKISQDSKKPIKEAKSRDKVSRDKGTLKNDGELKKTSSKTIKEVPDSVVDLKSNDKLNSIPEDVDHSSDNQGSMGELVVKATENNLQKSFEPEIVSIQLQNGLTKLHSQITAEQVVNNEETQIEQSPQKSDRKSDRKMEKSNPDGGDNDDADAVDKNDTVFIPNGDILKEENLISKETDYYNDSKQPKSGRKTPMKIENSDTITNKSNGLIQQKAKDTNEPKTNFEPPAIPSIPRPRTSLRPPSVRPASARPGAPRRRDRNIEIVLQPDDNVPKPSVNIKIDHLDMDLDDDGENLVIIEDSTSQLNLMNDNKVSADGLNDIDGEQQGHLVQQILATQKELLKIDEDANETKRKSEIEWDSTNSHQRQNSAKQMDSLRDSIQKLTKSINPLGKLMDFLQEDIDSMQMELSIWKNSYANTKIELNREQSLTESAIEPLKLQLAHIESNIKDQIEVMDLAQVDIMENEEKIFKLLTEM